MHHDFRKHRVIGRRRLRPGQHGGRRRCRPRHHRLRKPRGDNETDLVVAFRHPLQRRRFIERPPLPLVHRDDPRRRFQSVPEHPGNVALIPVDPQHGHRVVPHGFQDIHLHHGDDDHQQRRHQKKHQQTGPIPREQAPFFHHRCQHAIHSCTLAASVAQRSAG